MGTRPDIRAHNRVGICGEHIQGAGGRRDNGGDIMNTRAVYHIDQVTAEAAWIIDDCPDGARSVTNDAERVAAALLRQFGNRRFFYRDTAGNWDELQHDGTRFTGFAPASHISPGGARSPAQQTPPVAGTGEPGVRRAANDDDPLFAAPAGVAGIERAPAAAEPPVGGGEFSGAGASGGWDPPSESSSSDSGSESTDSGGSAGVD
jgi:hypothetical protein